MRSDSVCRLESCCRSMSSCRKEDNDRSTAIDCKRSNTGCHRGAVRRGRDGAVEQSGHFRARRETHRMTVLIERHDRPCAVRFEEDDRRAVVERLRDGESVQNRFVPRETDGAGGINGEIGDVGGYGIGVAVKPELAAVLEVAQFSLAVLEGSYIAGNQLIGAGVGQIAVAQGVAIASGSSRRDLALV